jgi:hypothetical protein
MSRPRSSSIGQFTPWTASSLAFVATCLAVGIPYWRLPYAQLSLPNALYGPGLAVGFVAAAALCWRFGSGFRAAAIVTGAAPPAAVLARVIFETALDPTSHNLWPFEVAIAATIGLLVACAGALVGVVVRRWLPTAMRENR